MRICTAALLLVLSSQAAAFAPHSPHSNTNNVAKSRHQNIDGHRISTQILLSSSPGGDIPPPSRVPSDSPPPSMGARVPPVKKKVLTAADVMSKSSTAGAGGADPAAPGAVEAPKIFSEEIYDDFQSALLKLEKRVEGGKGSLTLEEVNNFESETGRIVNEMKEFMADPVGCMERIEKGYAAANVVVEAKGVTVNGED